MMMVVAVPKLLAVRPAIRPATARSAVYISCACGPVTTVRFERVKTGDTASGLRVTYGGESYDIEPGKSVEVLYSGDAYRYAVIRDGQVLHGALSCPIRAPGNRQDRFGTVHVTVPPQAGGK